MCLQAGPSKTFCNVCWLDMPRVPTSRFDFDCFPTCTRPKNFDSQIVSFHTGQRILQSLRQQWSRQPRCSEAIAQFVSAMPLSHFERFHCHLPVRSQRLPETRHFITPWQTFQSRPRSLQCAGLTKHSIALAIGDSPEGLHALQSKHVTQYSALRRFWLAPLRLAQFKKLPAALTGRY